MTATGDAPAQLPAACPRCRAATVQELGRSPVPDVWTVYLCPTCRYTWRSTEPAENTDPDRYPEAFRMTPQQLSELAVAPSIPPLRQSTPDT